MKCPNCGFNSFDYLEECKKCKLPLNPSSKHKSLYKKVSQKSGTDSVSPYEAGVEKTAGYTDKRGGALESGAMDEMRENYTESTVDTEPDIEREMPAYYKRGQRRASHSDAGAGIKFERASHSDAGELISSELSKTSLIESAETQAPELASDPGLDEDFETHTLDPVLYSESNTELGATNLPGVPTQRGDLESYSIAGLKLRAIAFVIDLAVVGVIAYLAIGAGFFILSDTGIRPSELSRVFLPIYALLFFLASTYFVFLHYFSGRTIGKMAVGIKIISSDGRELGLRESFVRWVGYYLSAVFLFAGFVWSIFDQDSQAWHDKIAGTYVVIG